MSSFLNIFSINPFLTSLFILTGLILAGRICHLFIEQWLRKVVGQTETKVDDKLLGIVAGPIYWTVILVGIYLAILPLSLTADNLSLLGNVLLTLGLFIWGIAAVRSSKVVFSELTHKVEPGHDEVISDFIPFLDSVSKVSAVGLMVFLGLSIWGIDITPLFLSAGVAGVAVAFAAKDTVANLFGGFSVFIDRPYKIGDYVIVNEKYRGEVIEIGMRSTKIRTRDNVLLTIPNSVMVTNAVINETGFDPKLRIRIPLGIAYDSDLERVEKILFDVVSKYRKILKKPEPRVRFRRFGNSSIELEVLGVIEKPANRGRIVHELIKKIDKRLKREGVHLPYPRQDVHLYREK